VDPHDVQLPPEDAGWQFVFLGANLDSRAMSRHMGITKGAVVDWAADAHGCSRAMDEAKMATSDYRAMKQQQTRYRDRRDH